MPQTFERETEGVGETALIEIHPVILLHMTMISVRVCVSECFPVVSKYFA